MEDDLKNEKLKKLTNFDQQRSEEIIVENIKDLYIPERAERIADKFAEVSNEYDKLKTGLQRGLESKHLCV